MAGPAIIEGRSKVIRRVSDDLCVVTLKPTLRSFTFGRDEVVPGTEVLRLDVFEMAVEQLRFANVPTAFRERVSADSYLAELCNELPFEVIVKNIATGSTTRKYPGLFAEGHEFTQPVVKFDFRKDPEDEPIASDYLREYGVDPGILQDMVLATNTVLRSWFAPRVLVDFCMVVGINSKGVYTFTSEVSPDAMRLRNGGGQPLDKDLFRRGESSVVILETWQALVDSLREKSQRHGI